MHDVVRITPDGALLAGGSCAGWEDGLRDRREGIAAISVKNGATQMSFKVGDTVRLKSGSPLMTVINVGPDGMSEPNVACTWFSDDEAPRKGEFPEAALEMEESETEDDEEDEEGDEEEEEEDEDEDDEEEGKKGKKKEK
jgi:uncharacterized protein YodC (DUF2158 family)